MNFRYFLQATLARIRHKRVPEDVYEWFSVLYSGNLTELEFESYLDWAEKNPSKASQLAELEKTWKKIPEYQPERLNKPDSIFTLYGLFSTNQWLQLSSLAFTVLVITGVIIFRTSNLASETIVFETARAETNSVNLADGSVITLNVLSKIEVEYTPEARNIRLLEGEAYFKVSPDHSRPFVVSTSNGGVQALGTEFNTRLMEDGTFSVTLTEGSIRVSNSGNFDDTDTAILDQPGLQATIVSDTTAGPINPDVQRTIQVTNVNVENIVSWQQGKLIFTGEALGVAIAIINSHTTHTIHLQAPDQNLNPVFGVFNSGDWEGFISAVESSYPLRHFSAGQDITVLSAE